MDMWNRICHFIFIIHKWLVYLISGGVAWDAFSGSMNVIDFGALLCESRYKYPCGVLFGYKMGNNSSSACRDLITRVCWIKGSFNNEDGMHLHVQDKLPNAV